eukprot:SAG31_NODE_2190_length_6229_cov_11.374388_3_plen_35_part_00
MLGDMIGMLSDAFGSTGGTPACVDAIAKALGGLK